MNIEAIGTMQSQRSQRDKNSVTSVFSVAVISVILFLVVATIVYPNLALAEITTGEEARDFCLESISGKDVTLKSLQGQEAERNIVAFSFFNVNSKVCWQEIGSLQLLYRRYRDEGIVLRLISLDTDQAALDEFIKKYKMEIPILLDPSGKIGRLYGAVKGVPRLIVIGKDNRVKLAVNRADDNLLKGLQGKLETWLAEDTCPMNADDSLNIVYTGHIDGYLESCNCPTRPFGGLARIASCIKGIRKERKNLLVVDTGDIFPHPPQKDRVEYCLQAVELIGYDAIIPGDQEFAFGCDFIRQEIEEKRLPFVASNLSLCAENSCLPLADSYIIKELNGYRVAIIGVISKEVFEHKIQGLDIHSPVGQLKPLVDSLKKKSDLIVLLSHTSMDTVSEIAGKITGIDIIINGHAKASFRTPARINKTIILQPGEKGQYVGVLSIHKKTREIKNRLIPLTGDVPDDKQVREIINRQTKDLKKKAGALGF